MGELRLEQIESGNGPYLLFGLDENGSVWGLEWRTGTGRWVRLPMTKGEE